MRYCRYISVLTCLTAILSPQLQAQSQVLAIERQGSHLRVAAPGFHFLEGKPLERLHDGASVTYAFTLTLIAGQSGRTISHFEESFIVSFDLWEERYSVVQTTDSGRAASHLTAAAAEAWCLENMRAPLPAISPEKTFMIKLECRVADNEGVSGGDRSSPLTLGGLVDVLSRKSREAPARYEALSGPVRLADLKEKRDTK